MEKWEARRAELLVIVDARAKIAGTWADTAAYREGRDAEVDRQLRAEGFEPGDRVSGG